MPGNVDWTYRVTAPTSYEGIAVALAKRPAKLQVERCPAGPEGKEDSGLWRMRWPAGTTAARVESVNGHVGCTVVRLAGGEFYLLCESTSSLVRRVPGIASPCSAWDLRMSVPDLDPASPEAESTSYLAREITGMFAAVKRQLGEASPASAGYEDLGGQLAWAYGAKVPPSVMLIRNTVCLPDERAKALGLPRQIETLIFPCGCFGTRVQEGVYEEGIVCFTPEKKDFLWVPTLEQQQLPELLLRLCGARRGPWWLNPLIEAATRLGC